METFTILTTTPNSFMAEVHHRMPVILAPDSWSLWLGELGSDPDQIKALFEPFPPNRMTAWPVSPRVGNVRNDEAELIRALN